MYLTFRYYRYITFLSYIDNNLYKLLGKTLTYKVYS